MPATTLIDWQRCRSRGRMHPDIFCGYPEATDKKAEQLPHNSRRPGSLLLPVCRFFRGIEVSHRRNAHRPVQARTQLLYLLRKSRPVVRINLVDVNAELGEDLDHAPGVFRDLPQTHVDIAALEALRRFLLREDVLGEVNYVGVTDDARKLKPERRVPALGRGEPERIRHSEGHELSVRAIPSEGEKNPGTTK